MADSTLPSLDQMKDILDIEGIVFSSTKKYFLITLFVILFLGLLFFLVKFFLKWLRRHREVRLLPHEKALLEINNLERQGLIEKKEFKKFCFLCSDILRGYISDRFAYPALEKTTAEITLDLATLSFLEANTSAELLDFLKKTDQVKFAGFIPTHEEMQSVLSFLKTFVEQTLPNSHPVTGGGA